MNGFRGYATLIVAVALALVALAAAPAGASYVCKDCVSANDTTSTPGDVATPPWLADVAMQPPIAFVGGGHVLRCALPAAPDWEIGIVDPMPGAGGCSMALDATGLPLIAYHDGNGMLVRARRLGTGWLNEPVDPLSVVTGGTSITQVAAGAAIAYVDAASGLLKFAEQDAVGTWHAEIVAACGTAEAYPSLVVDEPVRAISYYDATSGDVRLATRQAGGGWSTELVDGNGDVGGYTSLVGGPSHGGFGVAYYDFGNADLRYAHSVPGGWAIETVDAAGSVGRFCSAVAFSGAIDDHVGIAYYDHSNGDLKYALDLGGNWNVTVLDTVGDAGGSARLGGTAAPNDTAGVAYIDRLHGDVEYVLRTNQVTAVPPAGSRVTPMRVTWTRTADGGGTIRFGLSAPAMVRVSVYDALGRRIAVPLHRELSRGDAEARWDGRDERGRAVGSGVFLVRVEAGDLAGSAAAVVLR